MGVWLGCCWAAAAYECWWWVWRLGVCWVLGLGLGWGVLVG